MLVGTPYDELRSPHSVKVWITTVERVQCSHVERDALSWLQPSERARIAQCASERARRETLASALFRRTVLARYLELAPESLRFRYDSLGKPWLDCPARARLSFSVAHCQGALALAASMRSEVGIDVECWRRPADVLGLALRFFSARERARLELLHGDEQRRACFESWTRREALGKALGVGLAFDTRALSLPPAKDVFFWVDRALLRQSEAVTNHRCGLYSRRWGADHLLSVAVLRPERLSEAG